MTAGTITRKQVLGHTDGACEGNPGPGGWAPVLRHGERAREISGSEPATTNPQSFRDMELTAAIAGSRALKEPCDVEGFSDSESLRAVLTAWLPRWKANGWRTKERKPVKHDDLWRELDTQCATSEIFSEVFA